MRSRTTAGTLLVTVTSLALLAGCGSGTTPVAAPADPLRTAADAAATGPTVSPLTGEPMPDGAPDHPVYVVKIDNTAAAAPQVGVGEADLVVEELVEGGLTRLAAMFYSTTPAEIGPVRSMRATDIALARPVRATIVASGGAPRTIRRITDAGIPVLSEDTGQDGLLLKAPDRAMPYDRILDLRTVATGAEAAGPLDPYLPFGPAAFEGTEDARSFVVRFSGGAGTAWAERGGSYRRVNGLAAAGEEFAADTVLVLRAPVTDAGYLDPAGNRVPETVLVGDGRLEMFHGGRRLEGRWSKTDVDAPLALSTLDGRPLAAPVGRTWIELIPAATGSVTVTG